MGRRIDGPEKGYNILETCVRFTLELRKLFFFSFFAVDNSTSLLAAESSYSIYNKSIWDSTITIVGIVLFGTIVLATVSPMKRSLQRKQRSIKKKC